MTLSDAAIGNADITFADPAIVECPYPAYEALRQEHPVYRDPETGFFIVSRYADVKRILMESAVFRNGSSESVRAARDPARAERMRQLYLDEGWIPGRSIQNQDEPEHGETRKIFEQFLRAGRIKELEPVVRDTAFALADGLARKGSCEFVAEFAVPLPLTVIGVQMGAKLSDLPRIKKWTEAWLDRLGLMQDEAEERASVKSEIEAQHYFKAIFDRLRATPDDTMLSHLVNARRGDGRPFTDNELLAFMFADSFAGGSETTTNALSAGMMLLARNPRQAEQLRSDPRRYLKPFIEEVLRLESPVQMLHRFVAEDTEVAGVAIPKGAIVSVCYGAANRDMDQFACPADMDLERRNPAAHLAFGSGSHHCLGAPLARSELLWGFTAILERLDDITLDETMNDYQHLRNAKLRALKKLHINYRPAAARVA